jgi:hypothetical protein
VSTTTLTRAEEHLSRIGTALEDYLLPGGSGTPNASATSDRNPAKLP